MREIYQKAFQALEAGQNIVLATVIATWGSAPRKAGSHLLVVGETMTGSVSGGCVEADVVRRAGALNRSDNAILHYGITDETAWQVGLSCGGKLDLLLESFVPAPQSLDYWRRIAHAVETNEGAMVVHELTDAVGLREVFTPGKAHHHTLYNNAARAFEGRGHVIEEIDGHQYFIEVVPPASQLIIVGASHLAAELIALSKQFDFETIVIDPREFFSNGTHFAMKPDRLHTQWPEEVLGNYNLGPYAYAAVLSHDPKIDDQALHILLKSHIGYIGALGSRKTHARRVERLLGAGFSEEQIKRIHAPIGVNIHAQSAREIALSILGEMISVKNAHAL